MDDVVVGQGEVMGKRVLQGLISADAGTGSAGEADLKGRLDVSGESLGEQVDFVAARDQVGRQVDGIAFGSASLGLGVLDDQCDLQAEQCTLWRAGATAPGAVHIYQWSSRPGLQSNGYGLSAAFTRKAADAAV